MVQGWLVYLLLPLLFVLADGGCDVEAVREATLGILLSMSGTSLHHPGIRRFSVWYAAAAAAGQQHACMELASVTPVPACAVSKCVCATKAGTVSHPVCACLYLQSQTLRL